MLYLPLKKLYTFLPCFLLLFFLSSCASSERMARLSGGVISEYSAPQKHRLRKESFQKKTKTYSSDTKSNKQFFAKESLINIWPFFFRSDNYFSLLWPFIDWDEYGFAVRPLLNKEGNDVSVLFPLSSWNIADKEGWFLNLYVQKEGFLFFPLAGHHFDENNGWFFYTPLWIRNWEKYKRNAQSSATLKEKDFTEFLLGYYAKEVYTDRGEKWYLWGWKAENLSDYTKGLLTYDLKGKNVPKNKKEFLACREKVYKTLPDETKISYGFFPLFRMEETIEKPIWDLSIGAEILWKGKRDTYKLKHAALLSLLYHYEFTDRTFLKYQNRSFRSFLPYGIAEHRDFVLLGSLLFKNEYTDYYKETKEVKAFRKLDQKIKGRGQNDSFAKYKPEMEKILAEITPGKKFPPYVNNWTEASLYLNDLAKDRTFATYRRYEFGSLPFFIYDATPEMGKKSWTIPILLTAYKKTPQKETFGSIPLFTWSNKSKDEEFYTTLGYIGYYGKKKKIDRINRPIFSQNTMQVKEKDQAAFEDEYALCGLYYHGKDGFYVAKKGLDAALVESIRKRSYTLRSKMEELERDKKKINERKTRHRKWVTKTKIEMYKKLIDAEEIRMEEQKYLNKKNTFEKDAAKYLADGRKIGAELSIDALKDKKKFDAMLEKFFDSFTRIRYSEDYGTGFFFRKELFENGDYSWHAFLNLAGGEKKGTKERTQFLHFFYRHNKDGVKEEKLIFPFISIQKDKDFEKTSFLWRVFEKTVKEGRTSGHIFFIPYGEK